MSSDHISVRKAIHRGIGMVRVPARQILLLTTLSIPIIWFIWGFSWLTLLHFPIGIIAASIYASSMRPKWRLWAYKNVTDIHQLQRAAELAELLHVGSHDSLRGWLSLPQRHELSLSLQRFDQDAGFIDDPEVPEETNVYERTMMSNGHPLLVLNENGIRVYGEGTFTWGEIENERIANVGFMGRNMLWGNKEGGGTQRFLRFEVGEQRFEWKMEDIRMAAWELDLLMYIYRGRWAAD